jgi:hypothetical protein
MKDKITSKYKVHYIDRINNKLYKFKMCYSHNYMHISNLNTNWILIKCVVDENILVNFQTM